MIRNIKNAIIELLNKDIVLGSLLITILVLIVAECMYKVGMRLGYILKI
ncbi:hypothetical protein [Clostridium oceanicum]|uniref:Uncharacterized protein n=1 Tax=Clostridium oceanicum TaxID=1543 RepID=A0ABP3ULS1_9CLOT